MFQWVKGFNKEDIRGFHSQGESQNTNVFKLDKFRYRKEIGKNWSTERVVEELNKLIKHVVSARTVYAFKRRLDISRNE